MRENVRALTGLHEQEKFQRETALNTLSKLSERTASLEQQVSTNKAEAAETLHVDQNRMAALEKWLGSQAEQFARFDPVLRELHSDLVATHQRLQTLEGIDIADTQAQHQQRLDQAEQAFQEQHDMLEAMQSAMQKLSAQAQAAAKLNRILGGGLIGAAVIIIVLLGFLAL